MMNYLSRAGLDYEMRSRKAGRGPGFLVGEPPPFRVADECDNLECP
jgi:hypothetical protein